MWELVYLLLEFLGEINALDRALLRKARDGKHWIGNTDGVFEQSHLSNALLSLLT
jgi:hypothetical protein